MSAYTSTLTLIKVIILAAVFNLSGVSALVTVKAQDTNSAPAIDKEQQAKRRPTTYLTVFNNGYGPEALPTDPKDFETLVKTISTEGNFNTIMCGYTPERLEICKKYNVKMIVDLLHPSAHVYHNPQAAEALCTKLRNDPTVVAYHLWADVFGKMGKGRERDIDNVHKWDPTHATYSGTYQTRGLHYMAKSDFVSYYDFAWHRGIDKNFPNLLSALQQAKKYDNRMGRYVEAGPGQTGDGNFKRSLFLQNTSIACGVRATLWFIGSRQMDMKTLKFNDCGMDAARVNAWFKPMWNEIPRMGLPYAVYATPITKNYNNKPVEVADKAVYAPGLDGCAFPKEFWIQPVSGEFVMGISKYNYTEQDAVFLANLNAYAEQDVKLKFGKSVKALIFNREKGQYEELKQADSVVGFKLEPGGGALVRFQ